MYESKILHHNGVLTYLLTILVFFLVLNNILLKHLIAFLYLHVCYCSTRRREET